MTPAEKRVLRAHLRFQKARFPGKALARGAASIDLDSADPVSLIEAAEAINADGRRPAVLVSAELATHNFCALLMTHLDKPLVEVSAVVDAGAAFRTEIRRTVRTPKKAKKARRTSAYRTLEAYLDNQIGESLES